MKSPGISRRMPQLRRVICEPRGQGVLFGPEAFAQVEVALDLAHCRADVPETGARDLASQQLGEHPSDVCSRGDAVPVAPMS